MSVTSSLPAKPIVFHGRDRIVNDSVQLLTASGTVRLAFLGAGGMGKTSVALALLHNDHVAGHFGDGRLFLSCEALIDADAIIVSLAKLLDLSTSNDLLAVVVNRLAAIPRVLLVLDNLETVWLAGGAPVTAVEGLLGRLAQIPTLSLIITCRGADLPLSVEWSNANSAVLEPFSLDAALQTFHDRAACQITETNQEVATQLLSAVDRMPLAVTLLSQLARRGNSVFELLDRWNRERTSLLCTHGKGKFNNVGVSIELSINMLSEADDSGEAVQLLSLCSMLPDGLRQGVFERLRLQFQCIERARDNLIAYSLASRGADGTLNTLSPIRHHVLNCHPARSDHHATLCSIYFDIAKQIPTYVDENFKELAAVAAPEIGNLSSLLLTLVNRPSEQIFDAVSRCTWLAHRQRPTLTLLLALLPHLDPYPNWKAWCLVFIGQTQVKLGKYISAFESLSAAAQHFLDAGDLTQAIGCKRAAAEPQRILGNYDQAEALLNEAQQQSVKLGIKLEEAECRKALGVLMDMKGDYPAAIVHLSAARQAYSMAGKIFAASQCSEFLGSAYSGQGDLDSAIIELEAAHLAFIGLGSQHHVAGTTWHLGVVFRKQGKLVLAEKLLGESEEIYRNTDNRLGLANCMVEYGHLRHSQGNLKEAIVCFKSAHQLFEELNIQRLVRNCREWIEGLQSESTAQPIVADSE